MTDQTILSNGYLIESDLPIWRLVETTAWRHSCLQRLPLKVFEPSRYPISNTFFGHCWPHDGTVRMALRWRHAKTGAWHRHPLPAEQIVNTLAHELAHLRIFRGEAGHGPRWKKLFLEIMDWMHEEEEVHLIHKISKLR